MSAVVVALMVRARGRGGPGAGRSGVLGVGVVDEHHLQSDGHTVVIARGQRPIRVVRPAHRPRRRPAGRGQCPGGLLAEFVVVVGGGDVPRVGRGVDLAVVVVGVGGVVADTLPVGRRRGGLGDPPGVVVVGVRGDRVVVLGVGRVVRLDRLLRAVQLVVDGLGDEGGGAARGRGAR